MKHTLFILAVLVSSLAMAQAPAAAKPDTTHLALKKYAQTELGNIDKQIESLRKALSIEQQIAILEGQKEKMVTTILQEKGYDISKYSAAIPEGDHLVLYPKKAEATKVTSAGAADTVKKKNP